MRLTLVTWQLAVILLLFLGVITALNGIAMAIRGRAAWPITGLLAVACWWAALLLNLIKG